jgi:anti-sigma regulatory factor (Ser/Thr protein kinase)
MIGSATLGTSRDWVHILRGESLVESGVTGVYRSSAATFPCHAATTRRAREFCLQCLREVLPASSVASELIADCSLVLSELTSNAVMAGSTVVSITVEVHRDHVRIAADDDGLGVPRPVAAGPSDPHGRGLAIVDSLSRAWGVQHRPRGKQVWANVAIPSGLMFAVDCTL